MDRVPNQDFFYKHGTKSRQEVKEAYPKQLQVPKIYANRNFASSSNLPAGLNLGMSSTNVSLNCMLAGLGDCSGSWNTFSLGHLRTKTSNPMPISKQGDPRESSGLLDIASKECQRAHQRKCQAGHQDKTQGYGI